MERDPALRRWRRALSTAAFAVALSTPAAAQTDYYNTDAGRPLRVEDAYPVERHAFELQLAPLRLERADDGVYAWQVEPELAYGILPGTHVEIGLPLLATDAAGETRFGFGGIAIAALHNLNVETRTLPAFAIAADVLVPAGSLAPDRAYPSLTAIATRTFRFARFHLNGQYTIGATPEDADDVGEAARWMAGIAVDRTFPLRSALVTADVVLEQPLHEGSNVVWTVEAGGRYQLDPYFAIDAGIGRRLNGDDRGWFITVGAARAFALRTLIPVPRD